MSQCEAIIFFTVFHFIVFYQQLLK